MNLGLLLGQIRWYFLGFNPIPFLVYTACISVYMSAYISSFHVSLASKHLCFASTLYSCVLTCISMSIAVYILYTTPFRTFGHLQSGFPALYFRSIAWLTR
uniref:Putative ovule protein n=1 Tax=Solanum chacoense TaxID=4108 RepID=A0A0V0GQ27_SOLCH